MPGRLYDAVVVESEKQVTGAYQLVTGEHIIVKCPLSDSELEAYRHHPDTFFGHHKEVNRKCETVVDLCDFMFESYKDYPTGPLARFHEERERHRRPEAPVSARSCNHLCGTLCAQHVQ